MVENWIFIILRSPMQLISLPASIDGVRSNENETRIGNKKA